MEWTYGILTIPSRHATELPKTLASLAKAGFPHPRLFIDGCETNTRMSYRYEDFRLEATLHWPKLGTMKNWMLALTELYLREPKADRYALFEDDLLAVPHLRDYLNLCPHFETGYINLITHPCNVQRRPPEHIGWYLSDQHGRGAVGLVFSNEDVRALLTSPIFINQPQQNTKSVDGMISNSFRAINRREWVHYPSLLQHTGLESSLGHHYGPMASYREDYDPLPVCESL